MARDVLITGLGAVTPIGPDLESAWTAAVDGRSGAGAVTRFDPSDYRLRSRIDCEVEGDFEDHQRVDPRSMGRFARLGVVAAAEALDDAGLDPDGDSWPAERVGTAFASGMGGVPDQEAAIERAAADERVSPRFLVSYLPNLAAGHLSIEFDARGPNRAPATACAAGAHAIANAAEDVRSGRADLMIAGGAESALTPTAMIGFDAMRALSTRNDDPEAASRPFDADRDGFVIAEGAGALVLEARDHAEQRGAPAYAELAGVGLSGDATHPTRPPEDARGLRRAMRDALDGAGLSSGDVDCVNAHATSTPQGDPHEATAIAAETEGDPLVWAPKSAIGHTLGAAGAIETALGATAIDRGRIPPTLNYETPDEDCDVSVVAEPTDAEIDAMLCNSAGFGGTNVSLALASS